MNLVQLKNRNKWHEKHATTCTKEIWTRNCYNAIKKGEDSEKWQTWNQRRFSNRCLSSDVIPVSVRLKSNMKTPRGCYIIRRDEKQLLNEHIGSINNTLGLYGYQRETYIHHPEGVLGHTTMEEWKELIEKVVEARQNKVWECQIWETVPTKQRWLLKLQLWPLKACEIVGWIHNNSSNNNKSNIV